MLKRTVFCLFCAVLVSLLSPQGALADSSDEKSDASSEKKKSAPAHAKYTSGAKTHAGLIPMYEKSGKLYAELSGSHLSSEYIVLISIARGIGQGYLIGGMTWGFGDDWVWVFRKVDNKIHIVRRNVRFRADKGTPEATAVEYAYTDSVLYSLPILTKGPKGGYLVDLTPVFMSDLPQISRILRGFVFSASKSTWASVKGFKDNVELRVAATYASSGTKSYDTVPDSRGATLHVHYSISKLPSNGYTPRLADDRVGYFLTAIKDFSKESKRDRFVRYVNRWNLQKADPSAKLSPPKEPIIFWMENTIPYKYRKAVREGILEWNKAFEKAGIVDAIEVRQQPDDAEWDPEDINYNTFRWITSSAGFAIGPSRVNPRTGQILDADILFDADFLTGWNRRFQMMSPKTVAEMTGGPLDWESYEKEVARLKDHGLCNKCGCRYHTGMSRQLMLGTMAAAKAGADYEAEKEKMIMQGLKAVVMHEVGHTLGLRHNFKASSFLDLKEINNPEKTRKVGSVASVMDYVPANIMPKGEKQGDYYPTTLGPYDVWAIEYGYKPLPGGTKGEKPALEKIAARSGEEGHAYLTDEDTRGVDPDPLTIRFDLGSDLIEYARSRARLVQQLMPGLVERVIAPGEDYAEARSAFNLLLAEHGSAMFYASRYVGGLNISRSHKGDKGAPPPVSVVDAKKQRDALKLLEEQVFNDKPFQVPAELYQHLATDHWYHWGSDSSRRRHGYPVHSVISMWQDRILYQLLNSTTLQRLHDSELKVDSEKNVLTTAELLERLSGAIFAELDAIKPGKFSNRKPAISSLRRNLQRTYMRRLSALALGSSSAPDDCQTVAYAELSGVRSRIEKLLDRNEIKLDTYTRAHLMETAARIQKVLDARLTLSKP